jgi:hypothetical protein
MKLMKCSILLFTVTCFFACSQKTLLYETKSNLPLDQSKNQYIFDNDTLRIVYDFWANKGILSYRIFNKLDVPVYIDWKKSSFILNGRKFDYWSDQTVTNTSGYSYGYYRNLWLSESSSVTSKPERVLFLAPKSYVKADRFVICPVAYRIAGDASHSTIPVPSVPGKVISVRLQEYDESGSPLVFRNYLTYSLTEQSTVENHINNAFYVVKVYELKRMDFFNKAVQTGNRTQFTSTFSNPSLFYVNE